MNKPDAGQYLILEAGVRSGDEGTVRLAAQLAGVAPCPQCDYITTHCRCQDTRS